MSAIINNSFRKYNADNFITSFASNNVYLTIGKNDPWAGPSTGEYVEQAPNDATVPIPLDTAVSYFKNHDDLIAIKKISSADVSHVIKRVNWTTNTVYAEFDHLQDDMIDGVLLDSNGQPDSAGVLTDFFVMNSTFKVYKCISNYGGSVSTVEPTTTNLNIFETSDHYKWKFMFEVQQSDVVKFVTSDWIPLTAPADSISNPEQSAVENAAVDGALEHIAVTAGGAGYYSCIGTAQAGSTSNTIKLDVSASSIDDYYIGMTVYITSGAGAGEFKTITDYVGGTRIATVSTVWTTIPTNTSVFQVMPAVNVASTTGSGAIYRVSAVTAGAITKVTSVSRGTNYRDATATVTSGSGSSCILTPLVSPVNGHGKDAVTELGGAKVMLNTRLIGLDGSDFPINDDFRKVHLIVNPKVSAAGNALATATTYATSEILSDSGSIIYTEFRAPINRAPDSTEDIKLVIEF